MNETLTATTEWSKLKRDWRKITVFWRSEKEVCKEE
jgi:hypothetical protein